MTDTDLTLTETPAAKRDELRAKIEASERRIAERSIADQAKEAAGAATQFVKDRPLTVLGGAVALGLVVGLSTKPGRRAARTAATSTANAMNSAAKGTADVARNVSVKRASRFGTLLADALVAYAIKLVDGATDTARLGQDKLEDLGDSVGSKARGIRRDSAHFAGTALDKSQTITRRTRRRAGRAVRDLKGRVSS